MKKTLAVFLLALAILLLGGQFSSPVQYGFLKNQLEDLREKGMTYRFLDNETVEVKQEWSGFSRVFKTVGPSEAQILAWADTHGVPVLTIDPNTIDTSRFTGWYRYWTHVPLSNDFLLPLVVADANQNGKPEVYGVFREFTSTDFESRVYELDANGSPSLVHNYGQPRPGASRTVANVDRDCCLEVLFNFGGIFYDYEQPSKNTLPTILKFAHNQFQGNVGSGLTGTFMGSLDDDERTDFLYVGSEPDSSDTTRGVVKEYVAEFDPEENNFRRVWGAKLHPNLGGFAVGDFDQDGNVEFVSSALFGNVYVAENVGDNQYRITWQDSVPFVNVYYQTGGDVDGDGKPEFFIGAVTNGYYLIMYESDGDNHYVPKLLIHFLAGDMFPNNYCFDVDGDGSVELVTMIGTNLLVLKSDADDHYFVWYLKREDRKDAVGLYDFNDDGKVDFIISKSEVNQAGRLRLYADIHLASGVTSVNLATSGNLNSPTLKSYPNPFNPTVSFEAELASNGFITITVFDVAGKKVATIINDAHEQRGKHSYAWTPQNLASGIYFVELKTSSQKVTSKIVLIR